VISVTNRRLGTVVAAAGVTAALMAAVLNGSAAAASATAGITLPAGFTATVFASSPTKSVTGPDDLTSLDGQLFVAFQNGVGSMGEPAPGGRTKSTVVEYDRDGRPVAHWDLTGKVDGMGADPSRDRVIATVNEDGNSSLYTITPREHAVRHFTYSPNPLSHGGGTDSVIVRHGVIFVSASAPAPDADGTTFSGPALYTAKLDDGTATLTPVLQDNSVATDVVTGKSVTLNLSDPDSSEVVPHAVRHFGGDVLLDSQGDGELIFLSHPGGDRQRADVLNLSTQVDDTAFATDRDGTLYVVDSGNNDVVAIHGPFQRGSAITSIPNDSTTLPAVVGTIDLSTGTVSPFGTGFGNPKGLLFASDN